MKVLSSIPLANAPDRFQTARQYREYLDHSAVVTESERYADFFRAHDNGPADLNPEPKMVELRNASVGDWMKENGREDIPRDPDSFAEGLEYIYRHPDLNVVDPHYLEKWYGEKTPDSVSGALDERDGARELRARAFRGSSVHDERIVISDRSGTTTWENRKGTVEKDDKEWRFLDSNRDQAQAVGKTVEYEGDGPVGFKRLGSFNRETIGIDRHVHPLAVKADEVESTVNDFRELFLRLDNGEKDLNSDPGSVVLDQYIVDRTDNPLRDPRVSGHLHQSEHGEELGLHYMRYSDPSMKLLRWNNLTVARKETPDSVVTRLGRTRIEENRQTGLVTVYEHEDSGNLLSGGLADDSAIDPRRYKS